jgi:hypothetical protein
MSWASFHVLEVMSSPKYPQKRVGYLGAVQSFRPDTEVLMLATNLLKKVRLIAAQSSNLLRVLGYHVNICYQYVSSYHNATSHHHTLSGTLSSFRPSSTAYPFTPDDKKEDDHHAIQIGSCLPGDTAPGLAQDQGPSDGRGRRSECDSSHSKCGVRAGMAEASRLPTSSSKIVRAPCR